MQGLKTTLKSDERQVMAAPDLPGGIRVETTMDGVRYVLPKRDFGKFRSVGVGFVVFGIVVTVFMLFWLSGVLKFNSSAGKDPFFNLFSIGMALAGLPGLGVGIGIIAIGIAILRNMGHSEVLVSRDRIWSIECIGPFKFRFKRDIGAIEKLVLGDATIRGSTNNGPMKELSRQLSLIRVEGRSSRPMLVAMAYPAEMVKALADNLTTSIAALSHHPGAFTVSEEKNIPVVDESRDAVPEDIPVSKPFECSAIVKEMENGFAVVLPPAGLFKGSKGLFFFSLLWNGFMVVFTSVMLFADKSDKTPVPAYLFVAVFWAIGIGMLLGAVNMGKRQTILAFVDGIFGVKTTGLFGTKEVKLKISEIGTVRMGTSGMEVNDRPVMELQVMGKDGKKKAGVLSERKEEELLWIAWLVRSKTGLKVNI